MATDCIVARYRIETGLEPERVAEIIAGEQSSGTFLPVPGETEELKARARARVVGVRELESVSTNGVRRGAVTGGDTAGFAAQALGVEALEFAAPVAPGAPLCRVHAPGRAADGREIVFKGGQNGWDDFFVSLFHGTGTRARGDGS
jgi:uncharacterized protein YgbK (DUF1537 family)